MGKAKDDDVRLVALSQIRLDGGTQSRAGLDEQTVSDYAALYQEAEDCDALPELLTVFDGSHFWLYDGFHRYHAAARFGGGAGLGLVRVRFVVGTVETARWLACAANLSHGLRRSNADKRHAVLMAFASLESQGMSDRAIAAHCGVSHTFVAEIRLQVATDATSEESQVASVATSDAPKRKGRDGKSYPPGQPKLADPPDLGMDADQEAAENLIRMAALGTLPADVEATAEACRLTDCDGKPLPGQAVEAFAMLAEVRKFCATINELVRLAERLGKSACGLHLHVQSVVTHLGNAKNGVWQSRPAHVCPYCDGKKDSCDACKGAGWVTGSTYKNSPKAHEAERGSNGKEAKA